MPLDRELTFGLAGVEVLLRTSAGAVLPGFYHEAPGLGGPPHLVVEIETVPGLARGRPRSPDYPGFERALLDPRTIGLRRFDAEGRIRLPDRRGQPVHATFRVGDSANSLEAAIRIGVSLTLPRLGGLVFHASAVARADEALLFLGVSGAGKSTIAAMLASSIPGVVKISDELVAVRPDEHGTWQAHVTPFLGDPGLPRGESWPVAALHFLAQAREHRRTSVAPPTALRELLRHVLVYVAEPETAGHVLDCASGLAVSVPCHRLEFAKDPGVAEVLGLT